MQGSPSQNSFFILSVLAIGWSWSHNRSSDHPQAWCWSIPERRQCEGNYPPLWGKIAPSPISSKWGSNSNVGWSVTMLQPWRVTTVGCWGWKDWVEAQKKSLLWANRVSIKLCPNIIGTLSEQIGRWGHPVQASLGWFLWKKKAKEAYRSGHMYTWDLGEVWMLIVTQGSGRCVLDRGTQTVMYILRYQIWKRAAGWTAGWKNATLGSSAEFCCAQFSGRLALHLGSAHRTPNF